MNNPSMRHAAIVFVLAACKREVVPFAPDALPAADPSTSAVPVVVDPGTNARLHVATWDRHYNAGDIGALMTLYAPSVRWYGVTLTREQYQAKIASYVAQGPGRKQTSKVDAIIRIRGGVRVTFTKEVTLNGKTTTSPLSFHLVRSPGGVLQIDEESDTATDERLAAGSCEDALAALARATDAASASEGATTITPPEKPGDHWFAVFARPHGSSEIELDPKTGLVLWGTSGAPRASLDATGPTIRALADKAKSKCK